MIEAVLDCLVEDYESVEKDLKLLDENDRHVSAAAITSKSRLLVTANLKDFPKEYLSQFKITPCHPDDLFVSIAKKNKEHFIIAVKECYQKLRKSPQTLEQYLVTLNVD